MAIAITISAIDTRTAFRTQDLLSSWASLMRRCLAQTAGYPMRMCMPEFSTYPMRKRSAKNSEHPMRKLFAQAFSLLMQLKRIVVALTLVSTTSCTDTPLAYQTTSELSTNLQKFSHRGPQNSLQLLNEATNFIWDTVYYFGEGTPKAIINQTTSLAVFEDTDGRYTERGALLVFKREDQLVQALAMLPPLYVSGTNRKAYGYDEAELIAHTQNPGPYLLRFVDR